MSLHEVSPPPLVRGTVPLKAEAGDYREGRPSSNERRPQRANEALGIAWRVRGATIGYYDSVAQKAAAVSKGSGGSWGRASWVLPTLNTLREEVVQ